MIPQYIALREVSGLAGEMINKSVLLLLVDVGPF